LRRPQPARDPAYRASDLNLHGRRGGIMGMHTKPQLSCVMPTSVVALRGLRCAHYTAF
jgi:hypothetical protein